MGPGPGDPGNLDLLLREDTEHTVLQGMFENLYALEDRLLGIFVQKYVGATRVLLTE